MEDSDTIIIVSLGGKQLTANSGHHSTCVAHTITLCKYTCTCCTVFNTPCEGLMACPPHEKSQDSPSLCARRTPVGRETTHRDNNLTTIYRSQPSHDFAK